MSLKPSSTESQRFQSPAGKAWEGTGASFSNPWKARLGSAVMMAVAALVLSGCELRRAMYDQPKVARPLQESTFFADGRASRDLVEGTVPWTPGEYVEDLLRTEGKEAGADATVFPFKIGANDLARGKERFEIYCTPCHDAAGTGQGMIVKRGFKAPPTFHQDRLRNAAPGYFYGVIKNGFGQMQGYAPQIPVDDRWRIVAYVRTLQFSQNADPKDLPQEIASQLPK